MKKTIFLLLSLFLIGHAAYAVSVNVTAGGLSSALRSAGYRLDTVTNLTITGTINARDFKIMRDSMPVVAAIDISAATINAYNGSSGTSSTITSYPAKEIPYEAFFKVKTQNTTLKKFKLPNNLISIGNSAFYNCVNLTNITIPPSVTTINSGAFQNCTSFTDIVIPNGVKVINNILYDCSGLKNVTIGNAVTNIRLWAFGCPNLKTFTCLTVRPPAVENNWFYGNNVTDVFVPTDSAVIAYKADSKWIAQFPGTVIKKIGTITDTTSNPTKLTYKVTVPAGTFECYFAGMINNWTHQKMTKIDSTHYEIEFPNATVSQEYKYCSGPSWGYVESQTPTGGNRTWAGNDVVTGWSQVYNPNVNPVNVTYNVTVPAGTKECWISGALNNWMFSKMNRIDSTHYSFTVNTATRDQYKYLSGPDWKYSELDAAYQAVPNRNYTPNDQVAHWAEVFGPIVGCMDSIAKNYNPLATVPAQCIYDSVPKPIYGCMDSKAKNYNPLATMPAQCIYDSLPNQVVGCMDSIAKNYNPLATVPAQCIYDSVPKPIYGCMDSKAKNYNPLATMPAQCIYDSISQPIYGCMDNKALNYNPLATAPGQCLYDTTQVIGCMDQKALNYNPMATVAGPCNYDSTTVTPPSSLTYRVTVPAGTIECYFAGMINNWTQQKMTKTGNLQFEITFTNATKEQEYKYCSGPSWAFGETTNDGKNRIWSADDVVTGWTNVYNPNANETDVTYTVNVPVGTVECYFAGAANNWQFSKMTKVADRTFKFTIKTAYRDKYKYVSGPEWKYCELDTAWQGIQDRNYQPIDNVGRWGAIYNPNGVDIVLGCTNPKAVNFNKFATKDDGSCKFPITTDPVYGCTNPVARNYNPLATIENGSCLFGDSTMIVWGCMNPTATNYNPKAVKDNGTCVFGNENYVFGCMNTTAKNYNPQANKEDGSCIFVDSALVIWGCTNPTATNYNPKANKENGSCTFVDSVQVVWGCTNVLAKNYNPKATMENGSCVFATDPTVIFGCTKQGALNYNPLANKENGSCIFKDSTITVLGCTNAMAKNYNPTATKDNGTCIYQDSTKMILGCTNPTAKNYNRLATHDNGTCTFSDEPTKIFGCTKSTAKNYNPLATVENGSCVFADTIKLPVYGCTNRLALNYNPLATVNNGTCKFEEQLVKGCTDRKAKNYNSLAKVNDGTCTYDSIKTVYGCTDSLALNYNSLAKIDNGNCLYQTQIPGCMDTLALNFNPYANVKDGSCKYQVKIWGCTDKAAKYFNPTATHNDGNCQYETQILGCTDPLAQNYNPLATKDNRTCVFAPVASLGCTNKQALNYNPNANTDNGTCVFETITDTIKGCMDKAALNYNPVATSSNGNCVYAGVDILGCTSQMALNYNPKATQDDESCIFAKPVNIVLPVDQDILVTVKDTLAKILENSCSFDFNTPIDTVYIVSSSVISLTEIQVVWAIKQGTNITNITSNYTVDKDGKALLYLSLVCNSGAPQPIVSGRYGAPTVGVSVQGVTVSSYYQVPSVSTRLITLNQAKIGISMYPNPVRDQLQIDYKSNTVESMSVSISSLDGKRMLSKQLNAVMGHNRFVINTSTLNEGIYMITIQSNSNRIYVNKLVKN